MVKEKAKKAKPKRAIGSVITVAAHDEKTKAGKIVHHKAYSYKFKGGMKQKPKAAKPKRKKAKKSKSK